jgi:hypothetical protein
MANNLKDNSALNYKFKELICYLKKLRSYIYIINTKYKGLLSVFKQKQTSNFGQSGGEKSLSFVRVFFPNCYCNHAFELVHMLFSFF